MRRPATATPIFGKPWFWPAAVAVLAIAVLLPSLGTYGFWEPAEMRVIEGAQAHLAESEGSGEDPEAAAPDEAAAGPDDDQTDDGDFGDEPEPPLAERVIGASIGSLELSERAARAPMALFGLGALFSTILLGWRLAGARAGAIAGVVLLSFPLFVFPSRLVIGDIATVCAYALIALGAAGLCFPRPGSPAIRLVMGAIDAILIAFGVWLGHLAAGMLLGAAAPLVAAASAGWLALAGDEKERRAGSRPEGPPLALVMGATLLSVAALASGLWVVADAYDLARAYPGDRTLFGLTLVPAGDHVAALGGAWRDAPALSATFDGKFEELAYGMFPWSAVAPIALIAPALWHARGPRAFAAYLALATALVAWTSAVFLERSVGPAYVPALAAVALGIGVFVDDSLRSAADGERGDEPARPLLAVFIAIALTVLVRDILTYPEKLAGVMLAGETVEVPEPLGGRLVALAGLGALAALSLALGLHGPAIRDGSRLSHLRPIFGKHGVLAALALSVIFAGFLAHAFTPALASHHSSKGIFDMLAEVQGEQEELFILGSPGPGHQLYARGEISEISSRDELIERFARSERAFAIIGRDRLCSVQEKAAEAEIDYYVLYDGNVDYLLLSNESDGKTPDLNPLADALVRERPAEISTEIDVVFDDRIRFLGYDMPQRVSRGETFEVVFYYEVLRDIPRDWRIFVHFDRGGSRFHGDHEPVEGVCGTRYWQQGDFVVDRFEVEAGGSGQPRGQHEVWTGFFRGSSGNWTNMDVSESGAGVEVDGESRVALEPLELD